MRLKPKIEVSEKVEAMLSMRKRNKSIGYIGRVCGVSRQRVWSVLKRYGDPANIDLPIDRGLGKKVK